MLKNIGYATHIRNRRKRIHNKELAAMYGVTSRTLRNWIKTHSSHITQTGRSYTALQVLEIFEKLGTPGNYAPEQSIQRAS